MLKNYIKCSAAIILVLLVITFAAFVFTMRYRTITVDSSDSGDGEYKLYFQQVGEPDFPFGDTHARLVLKKGRRSIASCNFDIANDGKAISADNWNVAWQETYVSAGIIGEEQSNMEYQIYYDGGVVLPNHGE